MSYIINLRKSCFYIPHNTVLKSDNWQVPPPPFHPTARIIKHAVAIRPQPYARRDSNSFMSLYNYHCPEHFSRSLWQYRTYPYGYVK
jgi:hypothetical protein